MYKLVKALGHIITYLICAITIDTIDVSESIILTYFVISPIISEVLWALSYCTCNMIVYKKLAIDNSAVGSIGYTISYVIYALILFVILVLLKKFGKILFANDFDMKLINGVTEFLYNVLMNALNGMIGAFQTANN